MSREPRRIRAQLKWLFFPPDRQEDRRGAERGLDEVCVRRKDRACVQVTRGWEEGGFGDAALGEPQFL